MATRQLAGQQPIGAVPPAVMENYLRLKQKQDSTRMEFERRVADARRQLLERHAHEQQAFWTGQPRVAWQPPNGQTATSTNQQISQRPVDQSSFPGPRNPAQYQGPPALGHPNAPANAKQRVSTTAVPPAASTARPPAVAQPQDKPATKAQPHFAPRNRKLATKKQGMEVINLCSDDDNEQPHPATATSGQQVEFNPPHPSSEVLSFFGHSSKVFRPSFRDGENLSNRQFPASSNTQVPVNAPGGLAQASTHGPSRSTMPRQDVLSKRGMGPGTAISSLVRGGGPLLEDQQTQLRQSEIQMDLRHSSTSLGGQPSRPSGSFSLPAQREQQQKRPFANDTLHHRGGQDQAPRLDKTYEQAEEDVNMKDAPAEVEQPQHDSNILARSHNRGARLPDRQHSQNDADKADKEARANYEKEKQRFFAIMQANGRLPAAEQERWMEIHEAELGRREERERTLQNARAIGRRQESDGDVCDYLIEHSIDVLRREDTITSQTSSQTLSDLPSTATDKNCANIVPLPTPQHSKVSPIRKRKVHNVSDDSNDDSEFEPSSSDDEPLMNKIQKPVVKKAKAVNGSGTNRSTSVTAKFGFKPVKPTKPNRPSTLAQLKSKATPPVATAPSSRSENSELALGSESPSVQAAQHSSSRRARQKAQAALDEHIQKHFRFHAEEDEREERLTNTLAASTESVLGKTLQRMSLTPMPPSTRPTSDRMETRGAHDGVEQVDTVPKRRKDIAHGLTHGTKNRMRRDRQLLKRQSVSSRGRGDEESESKLDLSAY